MCVLVTMHNIRSAGEGMDEKPSDEPHAPEQSADSSGWPLMSFGCGAESPTVPILLTDLSAESRLTHYDHKSNAVEIQGMSGCKVRRSSWFRQSCDLR